MRPTSRLRPTRDTVSTIREDGSHRFLFPADAAGRFRRARRAAALVLIAAYLSLPWIRVGGYPAVYLDVARRRFHLFGLVLAAQDLWLLFFLISGLGFGLFLITALLGRVWCGWACPQTVFLEHVYRRVERWIDGDAMRRRQWAEAPTTLSKILRRTAKHAVYLALSAAIAHLFLAYFVSIPALWGMMRGAPGDNWGAFVFIAAATGIVYFDFAWFREQLCVILCPYGRLQSALTDDHTLVIGYDWARGEPRGRLGETGAGDCVACDRCVQVCPTGIDIRQGLQMECIGCAACIDACDEVMLRVGRARGLVRYDSLSGLTGRRTRWLRPRTVLYGALLLAGMAVAAWSIGGIRPAVLSVTRMVGAPYYVDGDLVRNQFLVRLVNKRAEAADLAVTVRGLPAGAVARGLDAPVTVGPLGEEVRPLIVQELRSRYAAPFAFEVEATDRSGSFTLRRALEFLGPDNIPAPPAPRAPNSPIRTAAPANSDEPPRARP
ncbi:MAG TPA: cytochrome c oxidase accessory protein CcoG [Candidatus Sulfotelmatobacter sp.]|nr:cytochrome c oxidase accessory protein CcoG [Candidatus Sulfotelmatobacter sp.]